MDLPKIKELGTNKSMERFLKGLKDSTIFLRQEKKQWQK